ncbi:MAG TPA: DotU family type IV/VI secretion system protein [Candidatus Acidoferrum sp.]|jgi:type VI secretion system protein ImpK|nr:DotU family type IV/VI secretion system protein [Candidatus Acidoferrum sp.]
MTLLELTEPLFQYICRLNRVARKSGVAPTGDTTFLSKPGAAPRGVSLDYAVVRGEVKAIFDDMQQKAAKDFRLGSQLKKMELPLLFFIDALISESTLKFAPQWNQNRLAYERNELAGDEKFFDLLEEDLKDQSDEASERLAVFYVCIGLGFSGIYFRQPELLRKNMFTIAPRIKRWLEADEAAKICPDAYQGVDTRDLTEPPSRKVLVISLIFACLIVACVISYIWLYHRSAGELTSSFDAINQHEIAAKQK